MRVVLGCVGLAIAGCAPADPDGDVSGGLLGESIVDVFPNQQLVRDGALDISPDVLPYVQTPWRMDRLAFRDGFSPIQTSVARLRDVDASALPSWRDLTPGEGGVLLVDLTTGRFLPVMAELDAHPFAVSPSLIVRPQTAMEPGHEVAVVVTTDAAPRPDRFDDILRGRWPDDFEGGVDETLSLVDRLAELGVAESSIALAWAFPIGEGSAPLRSALGQLETPTSWSFSRVRNADAGDSVIRTGWRTAEGTYEVTNFLVDDVLLDLEADGSVRPTGTVQADLHVYIPERVKNAEAGTVPIVMYGHGAFGREDDLFVPDMGIVGPSRLADDMGAIVVSTRWRGLDYTDLPGALAAGNDIARLNEITDRLVQGQANARSLVEMVRAGSFVEDDIFRGADGQLLADSSRMYFYGVSMGGILGAVLVGNDAPLDGAVFHVGGSSWSTLLERSYTWRTFETLVEEGLTLPEERQLGYALSQLWFDVADPISYVDGLRSQSFILQENLGDDLVHNLTTRILARSAGLPLLEPAVEVPFGVETVAGPLGPRARALAQFDPMMGAPPDENRPAEYIGSHVATMDWVGVRAQIVDHFDNDGSVRHFCGDAPCVDGNEGSWD